VRAVKDRSLRETVVLSKTRSRDESSSSSEMETAREKLMIARRDVFLLEETRERTFEIYFKGNNREESSIGLRFPKVSALYGSRVYSKKITSEVG